MKKIIIIVEDGMVQEVLCRSKKVKIELLDLDEQNIENLEKKKQRYKKLKQSKLYKNIFKLVFRN